MENVAGEQGVARSPQSNVLHDLLCFVIWFYSFRLVQKMLRESKALPSSNFLRYKSSYFLQIQTVINSHSLMIGVSNLPILVLSMGFFDFWHFLSITHSI